MQLCTAKSREPIIWRAWNEQQSGFALAADVVCDLFEEIHYN